MNRSSSYISLLLSGLLAAATAGVQAQGNEPPTYRVPMQAGEASTMVDGRPNLNPNAAWLNAERTPAPTYRIPMQAGEASTMVQGRPNLNPNAAWLASDREETRDQLALQGEQTGASRAAQVMGGPGYSGPHIGTPATLPDHALSVFEGGTPK